MNKNTKRNDRRRARQQKQKQEATIEPNWDIPCMNCDSTPTVGDTELCGPCCFGEADTAGGNW